ncbi:MAG: hypothetical protein ABL995_09890 [Bryobacteraceae bacterium]
MLELVHNTAPFLFSGNGASLLDEANRPAETSGYGAGREYIQRLRTLTERGIAREEVFPPLEYFQLCVASHWATAGTFVPTDVDTKIRGILWRECRDRDALRAMCDYGLQAHQWDLSPVSKRITTVDGFGEISGHDGEWFSVLAGAHGRFATLGETEYFNKTYAAIDAELERQAGGFRKMLHTPGAELDVLRLAVSLTHNCGDLDQGISFWTQHESLRESRVRFHRLAHENTKLYGGTFQVAARIYREALSAEGHRHYPLRPVRALRNSADLLLPLGPFLDDWGGVLAKHPILSAEDRTEIVGALLTGCRKVVGQQGYFRALAGFEAASSRNFQDACERLPRALARDLKEFRPKISVPRVTFESPYKKLVAKARGWK